MTVEPAVEDAEEDPLRPFVVGWVAGSDFAGPVVAEADAGELVAEVPDILFRGFGGMDTVFDGILFCGQSEGVEAHGVEDVEALESFEPRDDVGGDIAKGVPDVQASAGGIWEHVQGVVFWFGRFIGNLVNLSFFPFLAPFIFDASDFLFSVFCHFSENEPQK